MEIIDFFPIPVGIVKLKRNVSTKEFKFIESSKYNVSVNVSGNTWSNNNNILDKDELQDLKKLLTEYINDYFKKVFNPKDDVKLYITNSWVNWNENGTSHHLHFHHNSIISCTLYVNTDVGDSISFFKPQGTNLFGNIGDIQSDHVPKWQMFNWTIPAIKNYVVMFPSQLYHEVPTRPDTCKGVRISLSFNTWFEGNVGSDIGLNKLTHHKT